MTALALLLLFQAAAATPAPTPAASTAPTPKKTPVAAAGYGAGRSLSDVARERKLAKETPKARGLTVAPAAGGIGGSAGAAGAAEEPSGTAEPNPSGASGPLVVVETAQHNDIVAGNGQVRVFGTVRNTGLLPACEVVLNVRLFDEKDRYLASGGGKVDEPRLQPGARSSYSVFVQAPPGVAPSGKVKTLGFGTSGGGVSLEGSWRTLGRAEAEVVSVADSCPGEKPPESPPSRGAPAPAEKPTVTPR